MMNESLNKIQFKFWPAFLSLPHIVFKKRFWQFIYFLVPFINKKNSYAKEIILQKIRHQISKIAPPITGFIKFLIFKA